MKEIMMKFRDNLLHLRQQRNMTQEQLAMLLGVSRQSVAKWEGGQSTPEVDKLVKMAELFGCTLDELVSADLTTREVAPTEVLPEGGPAEDVCGYDAHIRSFAERIAAGSAAIVAGTSMMTLADGLFPEAVAEGVAPALLLAFVAAGLALILPAAIGHGNFVRAHPYVEDFYTPAQREAEGRGFAREITIGVVLVLLGVIAISLISMGPDMGLPLSQDAAETVGSAGLLACTAAGVWFFVHGGIIHGMMNLESYNREREDERWERENPRVGRICGIIMLVATIIGLVWLYFGLATGDGEFHSAYGPLFWIVWPIGGILCGIVTLAMRNADDR